MSWMQKLYETYESCAGNKNIIDSDELCPVGYSMQNAHIEIVIDEKGIFSRALLIQKESNPKTFIPITESSGGRTSGESPHPLCDSLQYCASDYPKFGGVRSSYFESYIKQLKEWAESSFSHPKVKAVYNYVKEGQVVADLIKNDLLSVENDVLKIDLKGSEGTISHPIMKLLTFDDKGIKDQAKVFIRWSVESPGELCSHTWEDSSLFDSWREYIDSLESTTGFCYVTGKIIALTQKHPAKLRNGKDGAKLISSNDTSGYTFLGRFTKAEQTAGVSSEVTQKAHSALRWLIGRKQAFRSGDQVFVTWAVRGTEIPDPYSNSYDFLGEQEEIYSEKNNGIGDVGQSFAIRLNKKIAGYKANISDTENIIVMGLDSATPGRMAIPFYREVTGSEFLKRIEQWHSDFAWAQNFGKDSHFFGSPSPKDIAWAAYGKKSEGKGGIKLLNATVERLIPCIIDGLQFPNDLVISCVRRVSNRVGMEKWEWEKCLGITCSLYRGTNKERRYNMELEEGRKTRDYLYGELLAVAEKIESTALSFARENRDTTAARMMQRFSERPFSTWKLIENSLVPYMARINSRMPGLLSGYKELLDEIHASFSRNDYTEDKSLSGEYLLGYHCRRTWFSTHKRENGKWVLKIEQDVEVAESYEE